MQQTVVLRGLFIWQTEKESCQKRKYAKSDNR